jgi:hypothetical protein
MKKIILGLFIILFCFNLGIAQEKELSEEEKAILKKAIEIIKKHEERELLELMKEASKPKEKDVHELIFEEPGKHRDAEKLQKENDRLEDLLEDFKRERSALEWDMMTHRLNLKFAKPDPLDYQMALDSAIASAIIAPHPFKYDSWFYSYYPRYSTKPYWTNYEPLLFTLCTDSKGKMDWTKYGWLKILLKNK